MTSVQAQINDKEGYNEEKFNEFRQQWLDVGWTEFNEPQEHIKDIEHGMIMKYIGETYKNDAFQGIFFRSGGVVVFKEKDYLVLRSGGIRFCVQFNRLKWIMLKHPERKKKEVEE